MTWELLIAYKNTEAKSCHIQPKTGEESYRNRKILCLNISFPYRVIKEYILIHKLL